MNVTTMSVDLIRVGSHRTDRGDRKSSGNRSHGVSEEEEKNVRGVGEEAHIESGNGCRWLISVWNVGSSSGALL